MGHPLVSQDPNLQAFYEWLRGKGNSHKMAEMLAFREAPRTNTDREFFEGMGTLSKQFPGEEKMLDQVVAVAKSKGYKPNANDVYLSALAKYPGDPKAFVPATGGRGHIQKVCEDRGWECDGTVKTKYREPEEAPKKRKLAEPIIKRKMLDAHARRPETKEMDQGELRQQMIDKHGSKD